MKANLLSRLAMRHAALKALSASSSASLSRSALRTSFFKSSPASPLSLFQSQSPRTSIPTVLGFRAYSSQHDGPVREVDAASEIPSPLNDPVNAVRSGFDAVRDAATGRSSGRTERAPSAPASPNPQIYIGNLLFETSRETIEETFAPFGAVKSVRLITDPRGLSKGYGYHSLLLRANRLH